MCVFIFVAVWTHTYLHTLSIDSSTIKIIWNQSDTISQWMRSRYKLDCPKWKPKHQQQQQQSSHSIGIHRIQMEFMQIVSRSIWINLSGFYVKFFWDFVVFAINYVILIAILTLATEQFIHTLAHCWLQMIFVIFLSFSFNFFVFFFMNFRPVCCSYIAWLKVVPCSLK